MAVLAKQTLGDAWILTVDADPDTVVSAPKGSLAMDSTNGDLYQNTDGATAWSPRRTSNLSLLARGVDGATFDSWIGGDVTEEQNSGTRSVSGTSMRITCDANQSIVLSMSLGFGGTDLDDLVAASIGVVMSEVSSTSANWAAGALVLMEDPTNLHNFTTGHYVGDAGADFTALTDGNACGGCLTDTNLSHNRITTGAGSVGNKAKGSTVAYTIEASIWDRGQISGGSTNREIVKVHQASGRDLGTSTNARNAGSIYDIPKDRSRCALIIAVHERAGSGNVVVDVEKVMATVSSR